MKRLFDLTPAEVSLVGKGANRKKFLIFKSEKGNKMAQTNTEIRDLINAVPPETMKRIEKVIKAMAEDKDKMGTPMKPKPGEKVADMNGPGQPDKPALSDRGQAALKAVARIIAPFKDEITDDHLDAIQREVGLSTPDKTGEVDGNQAGEIQMSMDAPEGVDAEHHGGAMDEAHKAYKAHLEKMGYQKYPAKQPTEGGSTVDKDDDDEDGGGDDDEDDMDDKKKKKEMSVSKTSVNKSAIDLTAFPKEQRSALELIFKANTELAEQNKELVQKADKLEKSLADRDAKEEHREIVEKAAEFTHVGLGRDEIVETLADAKKSGAKSYERVCKQFTALNEQAKSSGLFSEIGSRQGGGQMGTASAQLDKLIDSVVQKSDGKVSREQIADEVMQTKEGKKLLKQSIEESQGVR